MSDQSNPNENSQPEDPRWLDDIQEFANQVLGDMDDGSACEQVHPVIARWYEDTLEKEPPDARSSVWQAISCLATEIIMDAELDESLQPLFQSIDEDTLGMWVVDILSLGRALEISLQNGELDDL